MKYAIIALLTLSASSAMAAESARIAAVQSLTAHECDVKHPLCIRIQPGKIDLGTLPETVEYDSFFLADFRLNGLSVVETRSAIFPGLQLLRANTDDASFFFLETPLELWATPSDLRKLAAQTSFSMQGTFFLWVGKRAGRSEAEGPMHSYTVEFTYADADGLFADRLKTLLEDPDRARWSGSDKILSVIPGQDLQGGLAILKSLHSIAVIDGGVTRAVSKWIQFLGLRIDDRTVVAPNTADDPLNTPLVTVGRLAPQGGSPSLDSWLIPIAGSGRVGTISQPVYSKNRSQLSVDSSSGQQLVYRLTSASLPAWNKLSPPAMPVPRDGETVVLTIFRPVDLGAGSIQAEHVVASKQGDQYQLRRLCAPFGYRDTGTYTSLVGSPVFYGDRLIGVLGPGASRILPAPPVPVRAGQPRPEPVRQGPIQQEPAGPDPSAVPVTVSLDDTQPQPQLPVTYTLSVAGVPRNASYVIFQGDKQRAQAVNRGTGDNDFILAPGSYWIRLVYPDGRKLESPILRLNKNLRYAVPAYFPTKKTADCDPTKQFCN